MPKNSQFCWELKWKRAKVKDLPYSSGYLQQKYKSIFLLFVMQILSLLRSVSDMVSLHLSPLNSFNVRMPSKDSVSLDILWLDRKADQCPLSSNRNLYLGFSSSCTYFNVVLFPHTEMLWFDVIVPTVCVWLSENKLRGANNKNMWPATKVGETFF